MGNELILPRGDVAESEEMVVDWEQGLGINVIIYGRKAMLRQLPSILRINGGFGIQWTGMRSWLGTKEQEERAGEKQAYKRDSFCEGAELPFFALG